MVTVGATTKQLQFDWEILPRSNYYELWFQSGDGVQPVKLSEQVPWRPRILTRVSAHLLDWQASRYFVKACNSVCTSSAPIGVEGQMFDAIGYFKPSRALVHQEFGTAMALSEDGQTMAVVAGGDPSSGANQNGSVAVYVFAKSGGTWRQQARLVPNPSRVDNSETPAVSISGNGNVIALGLLADDPVGTLPTTDMGSVYLFRRAGTAWSQERRLAHAPGDAFFGYIVKVDEGGNTLVAVSASHGGDAQVYRYANGAWTRAGGVPGPNGGIFCNAITLSGNGQTIARTCKWPQGTAMKLQLFTGPAWTMSEERLIATHAPDYEIYEIAASYDANTVAAAEFPTAGEAEQFPSVHVFDRAHATDNTLTPYWFCLEHWKTGFGAKIAVSRDGTFIGVSDPADKCTAAGSHSFINEMGPTASGAVYVYQRFSSGSYGVRRVLKRNNSLVAGENFSGALSFAENGRTFAIAQPGDSSATTGINGDRTDNSLTAAGAVWLY
jgi:hypothetical protein